MALVGIIANPASGKDIRRLVGQALVIGNREKVNIVKRVLIGLHSAGVREVCIMPDRLGIGSQSVHDLKNRHPEVVEGVKILNMALQDSGEDTTRAAATMREMDAQAIITLGGDGTVRVAAKGAGEVPILPISTGTNNVLPKFIEGTVAGLAAGRFAISGSEKQRNLVNRQKKLDVSINGEIRDIALVDIVLMGGSYIGSKAIWDSEKLLQVAVTRSSTENIGFSSIVGNYRTILPENTFGGIAVISKDGNCEDQVSAVIGPGMIERFCLKDFRIINPGERIPILSTRPAILALDGEREIVLQEQDKAEVQLSLEGPFFINIRRILRIAPNIQ